MPPPHRAPSLPRPLLVRLRAALRDERGSVALMGALYMTPLLTGAAIAIEFTNWGTTKVQLQRTADIAAIAGVQSFNVSASAEAAAGAAVKMAELNSLAGGARTYNASTKVMAGTAEASTVTAQVTAGTRNTSSTAVKVTVTKRVPFQMAQYFGLGTLINLSAVAQAETEPSPQGTGPACMLALRQDGTGIRAQGSVLVNLTGCSLRSNAAIATGGSGQMSASGFYASGSVTGDLRVGAKYPNVPVLADPYAGRAALQSALNAASGAGGPAFSVKPSQTQTLSPGTWSSWDISGNLTLKPGLYVVSGTISLGSQAKLVGNDVTIIAGGSFNTNGGAAVTLTAATEQVAKDGAMAGIVFASNSTADSAFLGNTSPSMTGVVYYPNGNMDFGGTAVGGGNGCLQVVAASLPLNGNPTLGSTCAGYNVSSINLPPTASSRPFTLVQ